jgi:hypothetical protein
MVEQPTAAAESMTEQARSMNELVRFFRVAGATPSAHDAAARAPAVPRVGDAGKSRAQKAPVAECDEKHAGQASFSTRRPPPLAADKDWREFGWHSQLLLASGVTSYRTAASGVFDSW